MFTFFHQQTQAKIYIYIYTLMVAVSDSKTFDGRFVNPYSCFKAPLVIVTGINVAN